MEKIGRLKRPYDDAFNFSREDESLVVFLSWNPREKRKGKASLHLYTLDNRLLFQSKPKKLKLRPGRTFDLWWLLPITKLPPGFYRVDIIFDSEPYWRSFFRMVQ